MVDEVNIDERADAVKQAEQPATGATPKQAKAPASAKEEQSADEINAKQIEEAKAAGKEYQGKEPDIHERASLKDKAVEK